MKIPRTPAITYESSHTHITSMETCVLSSVFRCIPREYTELQKQKFNVSTTSNTNHLVHMLLNLDFQILKAFGTNRWRRENTIREISKYPKVFQSIIVPKIISGCGSVAEKSFFPEWYLILVPIADNCRLAVGKGIAQFPSFTPRPLFRRIAAGGRPRTRRVRWPCGCHSCCIWWASKCPLRCLWCARGLSIASQRANLSMEAISNAMDER